MKKLIALLFALVLPLSFFGCAPKDTTALDVYMPDGATALSLAYMMDGYQTVEGTDVNYNVVPPETIDAYAKNKSGDLIVMPTNKAVTFFNKGAGYKIAAVMTHGNLFIIGTDNLSDLKGKTIAVIGKGNIPEIVFKHILTENDMDYVEDEAPDLGEVGIIYGNDGADVIYLITNGNADFGLLAEPAIKNAMTKLTFTKSMDVQNEWKKVTGDDGFPQAALLVKDGLNKKVVNAFLETAKAAGQWAKDNPEAAVTAIKANALEGTESTMPAVTAEVIERCNIRLKNTGLKEYIETFLAAAGLEFPADDIYYSA